MVSIAKEYNLRRHFETNHPNLAELDINEKSLKQKVYLPISLEKIAIVEKIAISRKNSYFRK